MRKEYSFYRARVMNKKEFQSFLNPFVASSRERRELSFPNFNRKSSISFHYLIIPKNNIYLVDIKSNLLTIFSKPRIALFGLNNYRNYIPNISQTSAQNFRKNYEKSFWLENNLNPVLRTDLRQCS